MSELSDWMEAHPEEVKAVIEEWQKNGRPRAIQQQFEVMRPIYESKGWTAHPESHSFRSPSGAAAIHCSVEFWWAEWWRQRDADSSF